MGTYAHCQSCDMPLKADPQGGGTEADGSRSGMYCSKCYQGGKFLWPDATAKQMQEFVKGKMREMGHGRIMAWFYTSRIPRLKRWKES